MIHLDTSFVIHLLREQARGRSGRATAFLERHAEAELSLSVFVVCELEAGAARAAHPDRERARLRTILQAVTVSYPDARFAPTYGDLLARILAAGRSVSTMDLLIATAAVVDGADLATLNRRHFEPIPGLRLSTYE